MSAIAQWTVDVQAGVNVEKSASARGDVGHNEPAPSMPGSLASFFCSADAASSVVCDQMQHRAHAS
jgi:hypothetical protein